MTQTLIDVSFTQASSIARFTKAAERGQTINACPIVAGIREALIDVCLTVFPCVSLSAFTCVLVGPICALGAIFTRRAGTLIDVYLAEVSGEACGALAEEIVDLVDTIAVVQTWAVGALICIDLTKLPFVPWHADAVKVSYLIQAGGFIHTWV